MKEQLGWRALMRGIVQEIPSWAHTMPHLPRLVHQSLSSKKHTETGQILNQLLGAQRRQNRLLTLLILCIIALITWLSTHHL
jgi:ubiquinone biosynthesis protein